MKITEHTDVHGILCSVKDCGMFICLVVFGETLWLALDETNGGIDRVDQTTSATLDMAVVEYTQQEKRHG